MLRRNDVPLRDIPFTQGAAALEAASHSRHSTGPRADVSAADDVVKKATERATRGPFAVALNLKSVDEEPKPLVPAIKPDAEATGAEGVEGSGRVAPKAGDKHPSAAELKKEVASATDATTLAGALDRYGARASADRSAALRNGKPMAESLQLGNGQEADAKIDRIIDHKAKEAAASAKAAAPVAPHQPALGRS